MMYLSSKKGGIVLKILAVIAFILMVMSIEVPRRAWNKQLERVELSHNRMLEMSDCEIVYLQEAGSFSKDLKQVYDFAVKDDSLLVSAPDIELEVLDLDSTRIRISFSATKHIKDVKVVPVGKGEIENIEDKEKFIAYLTEIGCPRAEEVMEADVVMKDGVEFDEIDDILKGHRYLEAFKSFKSKYYKSVQNDSETLYNIGKEANISLLNKNPKLKLKSNVINLKSETDIQAIANYKGEKDIYWDFVSKKKIEIINDKDPALDEQYVNMARYIFTDEEDKTPYLCPSTLEQFLVNFNLSAQIGMNITFFKTGSKNAEKIIKDKQIFSLNDNEIIKKYYLNTIKLKTEREVADMVREYELDGDSTLSNDSSKDSLFSSFFSDQLKDLVAKKPYSDNLKRNVDSPDHDKEQNFSEDNRFKILFSTNPGEKVIKEMKKDINIKAVSDISYFYNTEIIKIDTISVKIESPINENSTFKGYDRGILEKQFLFGIADDDYSGYVDNGTSSWKKD